MKNSPHPISAAQAYALAQGRTHGLLTIVVVLIGALAIVAAAAWSAPRVNSAFEEQKGV